MAGDGAVILQPQDEHAALGIGEGRPVLRHLVAHSPPVAGHLGPRRPSCSDLRSKCWSSSRSRKGVMSKVGVVMEGNLQSRRQS